MSRLASLVLGLALALLASRSAEAAEPVTLRDVPPGGLLLAPAGPAHTGAFLVANNGDKPVVVRARALSTDADPRLPQGVTVTLESRTPGAPLDPGGAARVSVRWTPGKVDRFDGFVVIEAGGTTRYAAIHGVRDRGPAADLGRHLLAFLIIVPFLGALAVAALKSDRLARRAAIAGAAGSLALAAIAWLRFVPGLGRADGNEGFQLVERVVLSHPLGVEWYVGVDGASLPMVIALAGAATASIVLGRSIPLGQRRFFALALVALGGAELALVALDLTLLAVGFTVALLATGVLSVAASARRAGARAVTTLAVSAVLLAFAVGSIAGRAGPALLVDGTSSARALALTSVMRASMLSAPSIAGAPFVAVMFVLVVAAAVLAMGVFPFSGWLADLCDEAPAPAVMMALAVGPTLGAYVLVRLGTLALPEALAWGATGISLFGAATALLAALGAFAEAHAPRLVARAAAVQGGLVLVGVGSLTSQGVTGALACAFAGAFALPLAGYLVVAACTRAKTHVAAELGGLGRGAPLAGGALAVALAALVGVPGAVGFWGPLLAVTGAVPSQRAAAFVVALGFVVLAAALARTLGRALVTPVPAALATSVALEPFGGRFPDLSREERAGLLPLVIVVLFLGLVPRPLLVLLERAAIDHAAFVNPPGPGQIADAADRARGRAKSPV